MQIVTVGGYRQSAQHFCALLSLSVSVTCSREVLDLTDRWQENELSQDLT